MTTMSAAASLVARSCRAQGLPETVTDDGALRRLAALLRTPNDESRPHGTGLATNAKVRALAQGDERVQSTTPV